MTTKDAFTPEEWKVVQEGPTAAGMIVVTAARGGSFRETYAMSKAYVEARSEHGKSELLDELIGAKPKIDRTRYHSPEELRAAGLEHVRDAVGLVEDKTTAQEVEDYKHFVLTLAHKVASAHREEGEAESRAEIDAINAIESAMTSQA